MPPPVPSNVPVITNPLSLYRSLLSTKRLDPDPSQHKLAIHLQKLYLRLIDYSPQLDYRERLRKISQVLEKSPEIDYDRQIAIEGHPIRRNPIFAHLFSRKEPRDSLALTRVLTNYEEAIKIQSPRGLLVHGEVGSGKSMLVNLLADGLPNKKKKKWHFNTFMLETLAKLEQFRRSRAQESYRKKVSEHSLLWLAKDMIEKSPILFLDEFQLPDKAASKIISELLTAFFHLGGVLIATSNRLPDELSKSSGFDFMAPPSSGISNTFFRFGKKNHMTEFCSNNEYYGFIEILKTRCEIWNMEGKCDWRRREAEEIAAQTSKSFAKVAQNKAINGLKGTITTSMMQEVPSNMDSVTDKPKNPSTLLPQNYFLKSLTTTEAWQTTLQSVLPSNIKSNILWKSLILLVFGRKVTVPRQLNGVTYWNFSELCESLLGPADYITLASKFHTFVIDEVPVMNLGQKNEARRLITLLDALYECRCKLIIKAEVGPDDLFFPELSRPLDLENQSTEDNDSDAVYSETISEIYQDKTSPFRPNISVYNREPQVESESDSGFKFRSLPENGNEIGRRVDFSMTASFTGEDERFAYKRARSRLWEMCGLKWHERSEPNWWQPIPDEVRSWECSISSRPNMSLKSSQNPSKESDIQIGEFVELDRPAGLQGRAVEEKESLCTKSFQCRTKALNE